jgi:uncharacterized protein (DUF952 family)
MSERLFHITTPAEWATAQRAGTHAPPSLASEGFVHLSAGRQLVRTANKHFPGRSGLLVLELDPAALDVVWEDLGAGEPFPHVYGPLPASAVIAARSLEPGQDGRFVAPPWLA